MAQLGTLTRRTSGIQPVVWTAFPRRGGLLRSVVPSPSVPCSLLFWCRPLSLCGWSPSCSSRRGLVVPPSGSVWFSCLLPHLLWFPAPVCLSRLLTLPPLPVPSVGNGAVPVWPSLAHVVCLLLLPASAACFAFPCLACSLRCRLVVCSARLAALRFRVPLCLALLVLPAGNGVLPAWPVLARVVCSLLVPVVVARLRSASRLASCSFCLPCAFLLAPWLLSAVASLCFLSSHVCPVGNGALPVRLPARVACSQLSPSVVSHGRPPAAAPPLAYHAPRFLQFLVLLSPRSDRHSTFEARPSAGRSHASLPRGLDEAQKHESRIGCFYTKAATDRRGKRLCRHNVQRPSYHKGGVH